MTDAPPDQVSVDMGAGHNLLPIAQWLRLPLNRRTRLILDNKVRFLKGSTIIPIREALQALKALR